ncbi:conserved oligomeric Golgi complex subunit 4 [Agrilus planipennis]|uniref:Conserved oligomeric Golgi complex subunit 4 n=1 Tax=Agrilus planipennis TaxID=224129 RepID=A0A7F5R6A6_AGRPL|nr:conserved oligomeric Golgi complex subunit 4 [Agrilus planipennis]
MSFDKSKIDKALFEKQNELQKELDRLKLKDEEFVKELQHLTLQTEYIDGKIKSLSKVIPVLKTIRNEAQELISTISDLSELSEKINEKVKPLEIARCRVDECQKRVSDLVDIELSSQGVQTAIINEDYEEGAGHVHRFLLIDQSLLQRTASEAENLSSVRKAVQTLQDAASQLRTIIKHKFDEAVHNEDLGSVERFFKIFPLLGMHEEGITKFCNYLCMKLEVTSQKNLKTALNTTVADKRFNIVYADTMTLLFEGIARIVDIHHPLIETYYGPGHLLSALSILQQECDKQTKLILLEFNKHRQLTRRLNQISEINKMSNSSSFSKLEKIDPKDLDLLIHEVTIMHSRAELYFKFVRRKVTMDIEIGYPNKEEQVQKLYKLDMVISTSDLNQTKIDLLSKYLQLEHYFMEESINKAVNMDTLEPGQNTSSMVDDTFFIIRKCIRRATATGSLDGICAVVNNACGVLENDFCGVLRNRLRQGYPTGYLDLTQAYNVLQTSLQQGRLQSGDTEQARTAFVVALNNTSVSIEYVETLCDTTLSDVGQALPNITSNEKGKLESCLSGLSSVITNLREIVEYGMQQLRVSAIKPRISPWVDAFLNINHQLTEDELSEYEAGDTFMNTLISNLNSLLFTFKESLTSSNYDVLVGVVAAEVSSRLEKVILKTTFNRLGGLILDKEIRSLAAYLTTTTSWSIRDKFARLTQIATVLNLEKVSEISDYWGNESSLTWRLTPTELRSIMSLRYLTTFKKSALIFIND